MGTYRITSAIATINAPWFVAVGDGSTTPEPPAGPRQTACRNCSRTAAEQIALDAGVGVAHRVDEGIIIAWLAVNRLTPVPPIQSVVPPPNK